jgi:hypothetical protein
MLDDMVAQTRPAPGRQIDGSSDRRWIMLSENGRFSTLSRASDPSEDEIRRAEASLRQQGLAGWLAIMSGSQYAREIPTVIEVRPLAEPGRPFAEAAEAFRQAIRSDRRRGASA